MTRRLLAGLVFMALAMPGLGPSPAVAECGANDPYDHLHYTFYWYECRRKQTPIKDLLPEVDPYNGNFKWCTPAGLPTDQTCQSGTFPSRNIKQVCTPRPSDVSQLDCTKTPPLLSGEGHGTAEQFDYSTFRICTRDGTTCRSTFTWMCADLAMVGPIDVGCVGGGVEFANERNPEWGVKRVCIGVGTPVDPPGTWSISCTGAARVIGGGSSD